MMEDSRDQCSSSCVVLECSNIDVKHFDIIIVIVIATPTY